MSAVTRPHTAPVIVAQIELTDPPRTLWLSDRYLPKQSATVLVKAEVPMVPAGPDEEHLTNGTFDTDLAGWTDGGATWDAGNGGQMKLGEITLAGQLVTVATGIVQEIRFTTRGAGTVFVRVGSTQPNQDLLQEVGVHAGNHVYLLASTTAEMWIQFTNIFGTNYVDDVSIITPGIPAVPAIPAIFRYIRFQECLPFVMSWGTIEERLNHLDGGGSPSTFEFTVSNTRPVAGAARFSDLLDSHVFEFARVTVYRYDANFEGISGATVLGVFYLEDVTEVDERLLRLRASDIALVLENESPVVTIARDEFPNAAADLIGATVPRLIGRLSNAPMRWLEAGQVGSLATDILATDTEINVVGGENFTQLTFMIGAEIVTATARNGTTFTGCTRASNGTDAADPRPGRLCTKSFRPTRLSSASTTLGSRR